MAATSIASSGSDAQASRKNRSVSSARGKGWTTTPPVIIGPTGCSVYSSDVAMPKLPPPPRIAQKRSGFSSALARTAVPSAITRSAARRLSSARPYFGISQPRPPPRVRPAMPVLPTTPPVVASPWTCVSRLSSFHRTPPWARTVRAARIHVDPLHRRQIDHQALVDRRAAARRCGRRRAPIRRGRASVPAARRRRRRRRHGSRQWRPDACRRARCVRDGGRCRRGRPAAAVDR